ncbi:MULTISPECIES: recombinase family protein [Enterobacterales]|uniref:recombinase family protein n=1 Tax=Enterobacterales TaxID=91347 RepID=UPI001F50B2B1|nr:recombinase family protein [Cronobacter sakazakii]MCI0193086.1 recombinase family protein [Cronobacter sakazakii]MCI0210762.1 recombinase family protein [Cronobacter sakazakii]MCI0271390.1 recombinase family protein [Cronobacter sakazakii]
MLIGYIRVSTNDQNTDLQRNALQSANCELIFEDRISGKKADRPGLKKALRCLQEGDTLVVWKLDRLGRSMRHLVMLTEELREKGINFRSLTDSIDTSTPMGRFFFHVMGALAEMERELIVERTRAGLAAAREKGRIGGRRRIMTEEVTERARRMLRNGATLHQVALVLDVSVKTLYRYIPAAEQKELEKSQSSVVSDLIQQQGRESTGAT